MREASQPAQCAVALKEWATVLEAMARGEQLVLIRKGGLIEPGSSFELASNIFVFYPTFEHQAVNYLRVPFQRYFEAAMCQRPPEAQVRVDLYGVAVSLVHVRDPRVVERLSGFHIYNDAFVSQRLKWQPEAPLAIVTIRAFRFAAPRLLPVVPRYAGCKSWVDLDAPVVLDGAAPILDEPTFQQRARDIAALIG